MQNITVYSTPWCGDCKRSKAWLTAHNVTFTDINIEEDEKAMQRMQELNGGRQSVPTIHFPNGSILVEPTNPQLEEKIKELGLL